MAEEMNGLLELHLVDAHLSKPAKVSITVLADSQKRHASACGSKSAHPVWSVRLSLMLQKVRSVRMQLQSKGLFGKKTIGVVELPMPLVESLTPIDLKLDVGDGSTMHVRYVFSKKLEGKPQNGADAVKALVFGLHVVEDGDEAALRLNSDHTLLELHYHNKKTKIKREPVVYVWEMRPGSYVRDRKKEEVESLKFEEYPDRDRWVKVVIGAGHGDWKMTMASPDDVQTLLMAFEELKSPAHMAQIWLNAQAILRQYMWLLFDVNFDGNMSIKEMEKLLLFANHDIKSDELKSKFHVANTSKADTELSTGDGLDFLEFHDFLDRVITRTDLQPIFDQYSKDGRMFVDDLCRFLKEEQHENVTTEVAAEIVKLYANLGKGKSAANKTEADGLDLSGFVAYMEGPDNCCLDPAKAAQYQDMTHPLSHYWIDSSHNTYLLEDQLKGPSSVEAYIRAMQCGCRCVEMDCWDGDQGEPIVFHGHTMTSKILFKDIITACKEHAFVTTSYPLILSIENHCSHDQQVLMAKYMKDILGDQLYTTPADEQATHLPSPEALKNKFVVKGKKAKPTNADLPEDETGDDGNDDDDDDDEPEEIKKLSTDEKKPALAMALSDLVTILQGVHFTDFATSKANGKYYQMSSFGESKVEKLASESPQEFIEYNERQLSRTYPGGSRVNSSNYDPTVAYDMGCQIVALNYQTHDREYQILRGRFAVNGNTGYVLKPAQLLGVAGKAEAQGSKQLVIKVLSANVIPKSKLKKSGEVIDPFVKVEVCGLGKECLEKTEVKKDCGLYAEYNETFTFQVPNNKWETAILRLTVYDSDTVGDDALCFYACPLDGLRTGLRCVPLRSLEGMRLLCSNLVAHISIF